MTDTPKSAESLKCPQMLAGHASDCWLSGLGAGVLYNREKDVCTPPPLFITYNRRRKKSSKIEENCQFLILFGDFWRFLFFLDFHCFLQSLNFVFFLSIVRHASTQCRMPAPRGMASQHLRTFERVPVNKSLLTKQFRPIRAF